jgi:5-methylcytosine-specific restriction endonuclease McrA
MADARDSKSRAREGVRVQLPPPAPIDEGPTPGLTVTDVQGSMRNEILALLDQGLSYSAIRERTGAAKATISYHARQRREGKASSFGAGRRYDWAVVQRYHDEGHSAAECRRHFGFNTKTWADAVRAGRITKRDHLIPLGELLVVGRGTNRGHLKARLIKAGLLKHECAECGITAWRGKPLTLHLDHINGRNDDDRIENLRLLCPNCHSLTETYCGGNVGRAPAARRITRRQVMLVQ